MCFFFFFKQKTAYEMRISDWSSDVCSSDLGHGIEKLARTRTRHGAEILDQLVAAHADTAVVDAECARRLVGDQLDFQTRIVAVQAGVLQRLEAQLVAGIRSVGHQLTQKNVLVDRKSVV